MKKGSESGPVIILSLHIGIKIQAKRNLQPIGAPSDDQVNSDTGLSHKREAQPFENVGLDGWHLTWVN